jgi:hypothetical protein
VTEQVTIRRYDALYQSKATIITTLPAGSGLRDGDTIRYKAPTGLTGGTVNVVWTLVYDASESYWYYAGGAPITNFVTATDTTASLTYVTPGTVQAITVPFAGDWAVALSADMSSNTAGDGAAYSYAFGSTVASDNWAVFCNANGAAASGVRGRPYVTHTGQSANDVITAKIRAIVGGTAAFDMRLMNVLPVRVR